MSEFTHWCACFGNATSIIDQKECTYSKNITLRYPVKMVFDGDALRFHFSNLTGVEPVHFTAIVSSSDDQGVIDEISSKEITVSGENVITIEPGTEVTSDELSMQVSAGSYVSVSIYLDDYTNMNSGVLVTGDLSKGLYAYGNHKCESKLPMNDTRHTNWYYFLNTIDVHTKEENHAVVCFGDSITAQDWPDDLANLAWNSGRRDLAMIRRAVSGTRILREYHCITYAAYGLKGETRFPIEMNVAGATAVILQHGINDIIHPVGLEVNPWRPMSDLPTAKEMAEGMIKFYINPAKEKGLKVIGGTLLPIKGWRTYAPFREDIKNEFNDWIRSSDLFDAVVDFDQALYDEEDHTAFAKVYDSGDHLHPSKEGYRKMAQAVNLDIL